jgi:hypothetical protein
MIFFGGCSGIVFFDRVVGCVFSIYLDLLAINCVVKSGVLLCLSHLNATVFFFCSLTRRPSHSFLKAGIMWRLLADVVGMSLGGRGEATAFFFCSLTRYHSHSFSKSGIMRHPLFDATGTSLGGRVDGSYNCSS